MLWSEKLVCIKCNRDGNLLVCVDNDCPLGMHKECMRCPAEFDDEGRFYCPYCWYKQAVAECRRAREDAMLKKKALLIFMEEEVVLVPTGKHLKENTRRHGDNGLSGLDKSAGNVNVTECDGGKSRQNDDDIPEQPIPHDEEHEAGGSKEAALPKDESEASEDETQSPTIEIHHEEVGPSQIGKKMIQDDPSLEAREDDEEEEGDNDDDDEGSSQNMPVRGKRGMKKGSTDTGSKAIDLKVKQGKINKKTKKQSLPLTPTRRSSRRIPSTPGKK